MGATGNSTYTTANGAAFAMEMVLKRDFKLLWTTFHPLIAKIKNGANFNKGGKVRNLTLILPVQFDDLAVPVNGVTDANSLTAITPTANQGDTQVEYIFSHYQGQYILTAAEMQLMMNGERGDLLGARKKQILQSARNAMSGDLAAASNAARANLMGLRYLLSTSNSPGGITQGGSNTYWDAKISTTGGTFTLTPVDDAFDSIRAEGRSLPDLLLLSYNATVNLFGKMRDNVSSMQRIVSSDDKARFGFGSFKYINDMDCVQDPDLGSALSTTGGFMMLSSDTFYWVGDTDLVKVYPAERLQGTSVMEFYHDMWCALGNDDVACNAYYNGYTG